MVSLRLTNNTYHLSREAYPINTVRRYEDIIKNHATENFLLLWLRMHIYKHTPRRRCTTVEDKPYGENFMQNNRTHLIITGASYSCSSQVMRRFEPQSTLSSILAPL